MVDRILLRINEQAVVTVDPVAATSSQTSARLVSATSLNWSDARRISVYSRWKAESRLSSGQLSSQSAICVMGGWQKIFSPENSRERVLWSSCLGNWQVRRSSLSLLLILYPQSWTSSCITASLDIRTNDEKVAIKRMTNIFDDQTDAKRAYREMHILRYDKASCACSIILH